MIRGTKRAVEARPSLKADLTASIHNRFDVEVVDSKTGEIKARAEAFNVICNNLWAQLLAPGAYFNAIHYGTGTGTPSASDSSLFSFSGALSDFKETTYGADILNGTTWCRRKVRIEPGDAVGVTISEVGIAYSTSQNALCTHAMLQDMNGNTVSITKTDTDVINIYATVFVHHSVFYDGSGVIFPFHHLKDANNNIDPLFKWILGVKWSTSGFDSQKIEYALMNYGASNPTARTTNGFDTTKQATVTSAYSVGEKKATYTITRVTVDKGNLSSGVLGIVLYVYSYGLRGNDVLYLNSDGNWWPGSSVTGEAIGTGDGVTTDFSTKFSFPKNATVYVDGIASDAIVSCEPLRYNDMGIYFIPIEFEHTAFGYDAKRSPFVSLQDIPKGQSTSSNDYVTGSAVYYNPYYSFGVASFKFNSWTNYPYLKIEVSDDLESWEEVVLPVGNSSETVEIPETQQNKKFWKLTRIGTDKAANVYVYPYELTAARLTGKNIHFDTPPADGAVITADYKTPVIAKDENHVFDLTVTLNFGEYTE